MRVEVAHAVPARVFEQLDQIERVANALGAKTEVLVVLARHLAVEIDVEQLLGPQRLRDGVVERQARHRLVRELRVEPDQLRPFEALDERERVPDRRQEDVASRLVRLRFERKPRVVAAIAHVRATEIDGLLVPVERGADIFRGVRFRTLTPTPHDVDGRAQLDAEIDRIERLRDCVAANRRVVRRERAFLEDGVREEIRRRHRHFHAGGVESSPKPLHDLLAFRRGRTGRHEVVVMEAHAVGAEIGEMVDGIDRVERWPGFVAERVAAAIAHRPQPKGEVVSGCGREGFGHACHHLRAARARQQEAAYTRPP